MKVSDPRWLALVWLSACGGSDVQLPATSEGWVGDIVREPSHFTTLMNETGRDGWIAFHKNDLETAAGSFTAGPARARAEFALGVLQSDLARMSGFAHERLFREWELAGALPKGPGAPTIAALAARCSGAPKEAWEGWVMKAKGGSADAFLAVLDTQEGLWPTADAPEGDPLAHDPYQRRRGLHTQARNGELAALVAASGTPLIVESEPGFERKFYDPCVHQTLSEAWFGRAAKSAGVEGQDWKATAAVWAKPETGLSGTLFAPWLTSADLTAELTTATNPGVLGATMPALDGLGVARTSTEDNLDEAKDQARKFTEAADGWRKALGDTATADGKALLDDLRLTDKVRQEWLTARARQALIENRPQQALAYAQLAVDATDPSVGVGNSPGLLAVLAEAELRNGHTRESLDAVQRLAETRPEVIGLKEIIGDLAVLEGLSRQGDSKEN